MINTILLAIENETERKAVEDIYYRFYAKIKAKAFEILKNPQDAEDVSMMVIEKIADEPQAYIYLEERHLANILKKITVNQAIDVMRRGKLESSYFASAEEFNNNIADTTEESVVDLLINKEHFEHVYLALNELDSLSRDLIILKYANQLSSQDIGQKFNMTSNNVNVTIHRGKQKIMHILRERGVM